MEVAAVELQIIKAMRDHHTVGETRKIVVEGLERFPGEQLVVAVKIAKAVEDANVEKIQKLEAKLTRKNEVMAELMEALTLEKKRNGEL
jgi:hypothetical protein